MKNKATAKTEKFSTRLGFILVSAGCAIGLGNVWRFPYIAGKNGGAIFVLIYLVFLMILGMPIMTVEFSLGRAAQVSPIRAFNKVKGGKTKWSILGITSIIGNFTIMIYYTAITGWMVSYIFKMIKGTFAVKDVDTEAVFGTMLSQPKPMIAWTALVIVAGFMVCLIGFNNGVEKITKVMMIALLALIVLLAVKSMTLPNSLEGVKFYLVPNIENVKKVGLKTVIFEAMNQAFFTLSIGIGSLAIFGSRIDKDNSLFGESVRIGILDTIVAIMSGLIIFPATASFGIEPGQGPGLIFITLPKIFNQMHAGRLWGTLFFLFLTFAAMSTVIAVFEMIITCIQDLTGWNRRNSIFFSMITIIICSIPAVLGYNVWSNVQPFGEGSTILDLEDFIVSANLLPLGSLGYLLFCVTNAGWGFNNFIKEANTGNGLKLSEKLKGYMTYVLPLIVLFIFIMGYYEKFFKH